MTTWNPADIGPNIVLSNGDLTATKVVDDVFSAGRATTSKSTGKKYFENTVNNVVEPVNAAFVGLAKSTQSLASYLGDTGSNSVGYFGDGSVFVNDSVVATLAAYSDGAVVGCAVDLDAGKVWFCDGTGSYGSGNPATGANPHWTFISPISWFPAFSFRNGDLADDQGTGNFSASAFTHVVPSGFLGWDEVPPPVGDDDRPFVIGLGPMGKTRVHPHPTFNRVKQ